LLDFQPIVISKKNDAITLDDHVKNQKNGPTRNSEPKSITKNRKSGNVRRRQTTKTLPHPQCKHWQVSGVCGEIPANFSTIFKGPPK